MSAKSLDGGALPVNSGYLCGSGLGVSVFFLLAGIHLLIHKLSIYLLISPRTSTNHWRYNSWQDRHTFCYQGLHVQTSCFFFLLSYSFHDEHVLFLS